MPTSAPAGAAQAGAKVSVATRASGSSAPARTVTTSEPVRPGVTGSRSPGGSVTMFIRPVPLPSGTTPGSPGVFVARCSSRVSPQTLFDRRKVLAFARSGSSARVVEHVSDVLLGNVTQLEVGVLGQLDQPPERVAGGDAVQRHEDAFGLVDHRAGRQCGAQLLDGLLGGGVAAGGAQRGFGGGGVELQQRHDQGAEALAGGAVEVE